jgi:hypothetical protein
MYYLVSGPLRREIGVFKVLVMLVDHPAIGELRQNLFWQMNSFVGDRNPPFLVPYLQFVYLAINGISQSDILAYIATGVRVDDLMQIARMENGTIALFCLKIVNSLGRLGFFFEREEFVKNPGNIRILRTMLENASNRCRLEALHLFARLAPEVSREVACWFLEPSLIDVYTDLVTHLASSWLGELLGTIVILLEKIESIGEENDSVLDGFIDAGFVSALHESIDNGGIQYEEILDRSTALLRRIEASQTDDLNE